MKFLQISENLFISPLRIRVPALPDSSGAS